MRSWHSVFSMVVMAIVAGLGWSAAAAAQAEFKLTASDATIGDEFGNSVSVSGDYAIVGARFADNGGGGSAYIFFRSGTTWTQQAMLTASDASQSDIFGQSVSISGDYAIVGAYLDDDDGSNSGSAYIFFRSGTTWTQQAKLTASDADIGDQFGYSVSINGDYAIAGAHVDDDDGAQSGSAYIFFRSGTNWTQQAKLTASDAAADDRFGQSVSISGDYAIVGAKFNDDGGDNSGSAYIFYRSGESWSQQSKLTALDGGVGDAFGYSVSIAGDYAIVGAYLDEDPGFLTGSAYIFTRSGESWSEQSKLTASDGSIHFGYSVSIAGDHAIVGAEGNDEAGSNSGSAYIFTRSGESWSEQSKLTATDGVAEDQFGYSVSINGDHAIVGAMGNDDDGTDSGSAYVYTDLTPTPLIEVSPAAVTMGPVPVNLSSAAFVKVKNTGTAALGVSAIAVTGADAGLFTATPSALTLAGGDSANVHVTFTPTSVGAKAATLELTHNAVGSPTSIPLTGSGASTPAISTSSFLTFGDVPLVAGIATVIDSIKIKNTGTEDLTVNPQNNMGGGFVVSPAPLTVTPGDSVKLAVGMVTTAVGRKDASLVLDHNDANVGGQTIIAVHANVYEYAEGTVVAWGSNAYGETSVPSGLTDVSSIAAGYFHNMALKSDGTVVAWGINDEDQTDVPQDLAEVTAIAAGGYHSMALKSDGTVVAWGKNNFGQADVPQDLADVTAIAAGSHHSFALKSDGMVVAWGNNAYGQLDVPWDLTEVTAVAGAEIHSLALKSDGTVVAWGLNNQGQTNVPQDLTDATAILAGSYNSLALKSDGTVVAWGDSSYGQTNVPQDLDDVTAIASGGPHSLALKSNGTVVAWGYNNQGQTNVPQYLDDVTAIAAGGYHSMALTMLTPEIADIPPSLSFGDVVLGSSSVDSVKVKNTGPLFSLSVSDIAVTGSDSTSFSTTPATLSMGPGDSAYVKVTFTPTTAGNFSALLLMIHNAGDPVQVALTGSAPAPEVTLSLGTAIGAPENTVSIPVTMTNLNTGLPVGGLQFVVLLGDTVQAHFAGLEDTLSNTGFTVSTNTVADSTRLIIFSTSGATIPPGTDIPLATLVYVLDPAAVLGSTIDLSTVNVEVADSLGLEIAATAIHADPDGELQIGIRGDVNLDGDVSILDCVELVIILVGESPEPQIGTTAYNIADANADGAINIADVIFQINSVLGISPKLIASGPTAPVIVSLGAVHTLSSGQTVVPVVFDANGLIAGAQFTFTFDPAMLTVGTPYLVGEARGLASDSHVADGMMRAVVYGVTPGAGIQAGQVLYIPVTVRDGSPSLTLTDIILVNPSAQRVEVTPGETTVVVKDAAVPTSFALDDARPNPFNPSTTIAYEVPEQTHIILTVYNMLGQEVVNLVDQVQQPGRFEAVWNGTNTRGAGVASGIYLYRIVSGSGYVDTKRMTLLK